MDKDGKQTYLPTLLFRQDGLFSWAGQADSVIRFYIDDKLIGEKALSALSDLLAPILIKTGTLQQRLDKHQFAACWACDSPDENIISSLNWSSLDSDRTTTLNVPAFFSYGALDTWS